MVPIVGGGVFCNTTFLTLNYSLFLIFLSIRQITKYNNCSMIFFTTYFTFLDFRIGMKIGTSYEQWSMYYLDDETSPTCFAASFFDFPL